MKYEKLFEPILIGDVLFKNRIFSSPTGHPNVLLEGVFTDDVATYYERKAQGGAAAITLGEAIVDSKCGKRHRRQLSLDTMNPKYSLAEIADRISRYGAVPSIELQHSGMRSTPGIETPGYGKALSEIYGPSETEYEGHHVLEMPEELIYEIIDKFASAAQMVQTCGFKMVTIHAGHGWLLNQFLAPRLNRREDRWGGSAENRARFVVEVCDAIHARCGRSFPVEVRYSASEVLAGGYDIDEGIEIAKQLRGHADIIHCSAGCGLGLPNEHHSFVKTHPSMFEEDGRNVKYAAAVKQAVAGVPVATVGALSDPEVLEDIIASGKADFVEMARGLICDPDLPNKARSGRENEIRKCMRCFWCFSNLKERGAFWCALNPETSRERTFRRVQTPAKPQKVLVVGGGVAGMQAALTAAENGHKVILCEKSGCLGGDILCEENVPFKKHLNEFIDKLREQVSSAAVEIRMNTEVTPEYAKSVGADAIIAALGSKAVKPNIPGIDGKNVYLADDVYRNPELAGKTALVLGAGLVGTELAIYLHYLGKDVSIVEMGRELTIGSNILHGDAVRIKLEEDNIPVHFSSKVVKIDENGVTCETPEGEKSFRADTVIYALGRRALYAETMALHDCATYFYPVGDCVRAGTILEANLTARSAAQAVGRYM